jgi:hypothetical protein
LSLRIYLSRPDEIYYESQFDNILDIDEPLYFFFGYMREKEKRKTGLSPYKSHTPRIILERLDKIKGRVGENH